MKNKKTYATAFPPPLVTLSLVETNYAQVSLPRITHVVSTKNEQQQKKTAVIQIDVH